MSLVTSTMAVIMQQDLARRGHPVTLGECEAVLMHVLDQTADVARRIALRAVETPLCRRPEGVQ